MIIATWNVNGIRARQDQVREWLARDAPDIVCLQETKASRDNVPEVLRTLPDYWSYWHGFKGYSGVALLVRKTLAPQEPAFVHPHFDVENRIVAASVAGVTVASSTCRTAARISARSCASWRKCTTSRRASSRAARRSRSAAISTSPTRRWTCTRRSGAR
ncbi:MAG: endonuclease/exonuclease/phosphatase family protein [Verrucomicrobiota bacterium]